MIFQKFEPKFGSVKKVGLNQLIERYGNICAGADNVSNTLNQILDCQIISDTIIVDINIVKSIVK